MYLGQQVHLLGVGAQRQVRRAVHGLVTDGRQRQGLTGKEQAERAGEVLVAAFFGSLELLGTLIAIPARLHRRQGRGLVGKKQPGVHIHPQHETPVGTEDRLHGQAGNGMRQGTITAQEQEEGAQQKGGIESEGKTRHRWQDHPVRPGGVNAAACQHRPGV